MLRKSILEIMDQLGKDIVDWSMIYPGLQEAIAEWIEQDRQEQHDG